MSPAAPPETVVTFDDQIFTGQRYGGVSMYFAQLLAQYRADAGLGVRAATPFRWVNSVELLETAPGRYATAPVDALGRGRILRAANGVRLRSRMSPPALMHHTYFLPEYLRAPARRRVCTVYDMIPELLPHLFDDPAPHFAKADYVRACDAVLCISQTTKDDMLGLYGPLDKPVEVTPLAVAPAFAEAPPTEPSGRLLYVGRRAGYKNFDVVLQALARPGRGAPAPLLCVGGGPFRSEELARIDELGLTGLVEQRVVPGEQMPGVYASSIALVFPSSYEGFGLPIVEAFAAGCPVVVADTPCSIEVSGGAAAVFADDDPDALAEILDRLTRDPAARAEWIAAGRRRARDFSWRRTAALTADVYRRVLDS